jgi:hypothetical protein
MIEIREPFPEYAWPMAWGWADTCRAQIADDFFPPTIDAFVELSLSRYRRTFGLWKDGLLSGAVAVEWASPVVMTAHILLSKRLWGVPASDLRAVAQLLFDTEASLIRIQAFVPAWNRLAIALAKRLGGSVEGTLRSATMRSGKPADAVLVAITREEFFNGPELRIAVGADGIEYVAVDQRDIRPGSVGSPGAAGGNAVERSVGSERRNVVAGSDGGGDGGRQRDQPDVERADKPGNSDARGKGIRAKRDNRAGNASGRAKPRKPGRK